MEIERSGITRVVLLTKRLAIKTPQVRNRTDFDRTGINAFVRGWLANRSEWKQRHRYGINPPLGTIGYVVNLYLRGDDLDPSNDHQEWQWDDEKMDWSDEWFAELATHANTYGFNGDEFKPSSWKQFGGRWLLIDYDRAWAKPRGLVGWWYYGLQKKNARRWADLGKK